MRGKRWKENRAWWNLSSEAKKLKILEVLLSFPFSVFKSRQDTNDAKVEAKASSEETQEWPEQKQGQFVKLQFS